MITAPVILAASLFAGQPTGDQVKSVFEHFYKGQGKGIVLADAFLCKTIEKKKRDTKYDCVEKFAESGAKGDTVNVYMKFLVPKGDEKELMVQSVHNGVVRSTKDFKLKGGNVIRTRTWKAFTLKKEGKWEFKILEDGKVIKTLTIEASG